MSVLHFLHFPGLNELCSPPQPRLGVIRELGIWLITRWSWGDAAWRGVRGQICICSWLWEQTARSVPQQPPSTWTCCCWQAASPSPCALRAAAAGEVPASHPADLNVSSRNLSSRQNGVLSAQLSIPGEHHQLWDAANQVYKCTNFFKINQFALLFSEAFPSGLMAWQVFREAGGCPPPLRVMPLGLARSFPWEIGAFWWELPRDLNPCLFPSHGKPKRRDAFPMKNSYD